VVLVAGRARCAGVRHGRRCGLVFPPAPHPRRAVCAILDGVVAFRAPHSRKTEHLRTILTGVDYITPKKRISDVCAFTLTDKGLTRTLAKVVEILDNGEHARLVVMEEQKDGSGSRTYALKTHDNKWEEGGSRGSHSGSPVLGYTHDGTTKSLILGFDSKFAKWLEPFTTEPVVHFLYDNGTLTVRVP